MTLDSPFAQDGPLSRLRERVGERALLNPTPQPSRNTLREQARSYEFRGPQSAPKTFFAKLVAAPAGFSRIPFSCWAITLNSPSSACSVT